MHSHPKIFSAHLGPVTSFGLGEAPPSRSLIGTLDRKAVDVHGELPKVGANPGSVADSRKLQ